MGERPRRTCHKKTQTKRLSFFPSCPGRSTSACAPSFSPSPGCWQGCEKHGKGERLHVLGGETASTQTSGESVFPFIFASPTVHFSEPVKQFTVQRWSLSNSRAPIVAFQTFIVESTPPDAMSHSDRAVRHIGHRRRPSGCRFAYPFPDTPLTLPTPPNRQPGRRARGAPARRQAARSNRQRSQGCGAGSKPHRTQRREYRA